MIEAGWAIRFFEANNYNDKSTIDFASNYGDNARTFDTVKTFSGMYGIDNYLVWYIHKNLPSYDFSTVALNLRLTMYKNVEAIYFNEFYRVQDVRYDANKSKYVLFAISEGSYRLRKKLISYGVTSLSYKEDRKAEDVIKDVIQNNNIFHVVFHKDTESTKKLPNYEYRYFDIDLEWTVLDFIQYICDDNLFEWCLDKFVDEDNVPHFALHIGHELKPLMYRNATKNYNYESDNISTTIYGFKISTDPSPMDVLAHWEEEYKCIWATHSAGKGGGISRGYFFTLGQVHLNKELYLRLLEGDIEKDIGYSLLTKRKVRIPSIGIGNILTDEGNEYIDSISLQKNPDTYSIREPSNIIINRGDDLAVQHQLEHVGRWTPYADHEAGLFFPSPKLENPPPNSLLFNVDGKRESTVAGGFVYGNGREEFNIPFKEKDDFRLRFPHGEIYYQDHLGDESEDDKVSYWIIQAKKGFTVKTGYVTKYNEVPIFSTSVPNYAGNEWASLTFHDNYFIIDGQVNQLTLSDDGSFYITPKTDPSGQNPPKFSVVFNNSNGKLDIKADSEININIESNGILSSGTVNINTTGVVNIGANASAVNIRGGAKALAHANHIHQIPPGPAIPGPPVSTSECTDNTTKTKAD